MNLKDRILCERLTEAGQLTGGDRDRVQADPELTELLADNEALACVDATMLAAPPWENLRSRVLDQAMTKEQPMNAFRNLSRGRRLALQAAAVLLLATGVLAISLMWPAGPPRAFATSNGSVLVFDLPVTAYVEGQDCQCASWDACTCPYMGDAGRVLNTWARERGGEFNNLPANNAPDSPWQVQLKTLSRHEDDVIVSYQLEITLAGLLPEELESLTAALAQVECLPVPRVMDATCFHLAEMQPDFGFSIVLFNQAFFFPRDATAAEVENEINNWLAVEQPEGYTGVEVDIERKLGGSLTISLDLKEAGE